MSISIEFRDLLILIGIGNGLILAIYMLVGRERSIARSFLSLLIICLSYNVLLYVILKYRVFDDYPILHWLPFGLSFIIGPLLYFYVQAIISNSFRMTLKRYSHFLLILLDYPHSFYHIIYGREVLHLDLHYFLDKFSFFSIIAIGIYLYLTYKLVHNYNKQLPNYLSNPQRFRLNWLSDSIIACSGFFLVVFVYGAFDFVFDFNFESAYVLNVIFTVAIIWLGLRGVRQDQNTIDFPKQPSPKNEQDDGEQIILKLQEVMEGQKLYLIPDLTLRNVEDQVGFTSKDISLAINQLLEKNFYQFVNDYRIEEFKSKVIDASNNHLTLLGIAQESGFSSKATFNRVFKANTGLTPKEYLLKCKAKGLNKIP